MKGYIRKSFKRELLCGFLVAAVVPLILTSSLLIRLFQMRLESEDTKRDLQQVEKIEAALRTQVEEFDTVTKRLGTDKKLLEGMKLIASETSKTISREKGGQDGVTLEAGSQIYARLYALTEGIRDQAQFDIYTDTGQCICSTGAGTIHGKLPVYWGILRAAAAEPDKMVLHQELQSAEDADTLLKAAKLIQNEEGGLMGYVVISLREEHFEKILGGLYGSQDGVCILNQFWNPIYCTGTAEKAEIAQVLRYQLLLGEQLSTSYQNSNVYINEIGSTGLFVVCLRPQTLAAGTIKTMYRVMFVMTLVSMALCIAVAYGLSNNLTRPVRLLTDAMKGVQKGRLDTRVETDRQDELGQLARHFNTMTVELAGHIERQVSQQRELNETSIAMMQSQLNHFLYNTLDTTMKWAAKANGVEELATMATKLAKILRTSISGEPFISLKEELNLVDSYIRIQQIRFSGSFHYKADVPEDLLNCTVPKLILQPIVENALLHGLEGREDGHILVTARRSDQELQIEVWDNGRGISPEKLQELNTRSEKKPQGHIGFYNVDTILRLHYGDQYGLHATQPQQGGTRITIRLPI